MENEASDPAPIRVGALVPLSAPGWVEAGTHLLAGLNLGIAHLNAAGGIRGRFIELAARDTAADPHRAAAAVEDLAGLGVVAIVGEYHSIAACAAASKAEALGMPFLCSSAVLDRLTEETASWVARIAPAQSYAWRIYAEYLLSLGHRTVALATQPSRYWSAGARILGDVLASRGGSIIELDTTVQSINTLCDALAASGASGLLILTGFPEPAVPLVGAVRKDRRLREILIGAPAGQPEFAEWLSRLGDVGTSVPFLRYLPDRPTMLGLHVQSALQNRLGREPLFMAYEGYDTILVLADLLRLREEETSRTVNGWPAICIDGTRGRIQFSRMPGVSTWQWIWPPVQVVDRDPTAPAVFRVLYTDNPSKK